MLSKLYMSVYKEFLLLKRDFGGAVILFVMPLVLIITVTLIQDSTFKKVSDTQIPILLVDLDNGKVSQSVKDNLRQAEAFSLVTQIQGKALTEQQAMEAVFKGKYQLAIVIPPRLSADLQAKIDQNVSKIVGSFSQTEAVPASTAPLAKKEVRLYFDPAVQSSFKNAVMSSIDKMISQIETQSIYTAFQEQLGDEVAAFQQQSVIDYKEIVPKIGDKEVIPNAVQHNVPAWTLFAIFFIVIPLSINIVKEKNQGTAIRLRTNPVPYAIVMAGKSITYSLICLIQFFMMVAVAVFLFPRMGLPPLHLEGKLLMMTLVAFFSGFAAIGFGILIGTIAKTQEQSAPFGATATIVLAAIGGVWVPVFAMPEAMQLIAKCSPMNWGLTAFYDVLLRNARLVDILPELGLLSLFFCINVTLALFYDKKKRAV